MWLKCRMSAFRAGFNGEHSSALLRMVRFHTREKLTNTVEYFWHNFSNLSYSCQISGYRALKYRCIRQGCKWPLVKIPENWDRTQNCQIKIIAEKALKTAKIAEFCYLAGNLHPCMKNVLWPLSFWPQWPGYPWWLPKTRKGYRSVCHMSGVVYLVCIRVGVWRNIHKKLCCVGLYFRYHHETNITMLTILCAINRGKCYKWRVYLAVSYQLMLTLAVVCQLKYK